MKGLAIVIYAWLHHRMIWWILLMYALGAFFPQFGLWISHFADAELGSGSALKAVLAIILFNAGLGVEPEQLKQIARVWHRFIFAVALGIVAPVTIVLSMTLLLRSMGAPDTWYLMVLGLGIVAAMPTGGASTAWAQNADANLAMSLAIVLLSTIVCPITSTATIQLAQVAIPSKAFTGDSIDPSTSALFLASWVVLPVLLGIVGHALLGSDRVNRAKPVLKLVNLISLLLLYHLSAAVALPGAFRSSALSTILLAFMGATALALLLFLASGWLARVFGTDRPEKVSLFFGIPIKNNGAAMVLTSSVMASQGLVLLGIITYSLAQNIGVALIDRHVLGRTGEPAPEEA